MKTISKQLAVRVAAALIVLICLTVSIASAQIDVGSFQLFQNGSLVGVIYVPAHASESLYAEHWILFANYQYPNARNGVKTQIVADSRTSYASEEEFYRRAPWATGYRYVYVMSHDMPALIRQDRRHRWIKNENAGRNAGVARFP